MLVENDVMWAKRGGIGGAGLSLNSYHAGLNPKFEHPVNIQLYWSFHRYGRILVLNSWEKLVESKGLSSDIKAISKWPLNDNQPWDIRILLQYLFLTNILEYVRKQYTLTYWMHGLQISMDEPRSSYYSHLSKCKIFNPRIDRSLTRYNLGRYTPIHHGRVGRPLLYQAKLNSPLAQFNIPSECRHATKPFFKKEKNGKNQLSNL